MHPISLALVDDHPILLSGLERIFSEMPRFQVVATGRCASDFVKIFETRPDVMLVDLNMPGDIFTAIAQSQQTWQGTKIIAFTASDDTQNAVRALEAGASGYVLKGSTDDELIRAIDMVCAGDTFLTPTLAVKVISALRGPDVPAGNSLNVKLSVREDQIVRLLLVGRTNREIASRLKISEKTVKHYMSLLMQKLHARNRVEVVLAAQGLETYDRAPPLRAPDSSAFN